MKKSKKRQKKQEKQNIKQKNMICKYPKIVKDHVHKVK